MNTENKTTTDSTTVVEQTPEVIQSTIISALSDSSNEEIHVDSSGKPSEAPRVVEPVVPTFTPAPLWDQLKTKLSSDESPWEIPAEIKEGKFGEGNTELDAFIEHIYKNTDFSSVAPTIDDPFVQDYLEAKTKENFSREEWLKSQAGKASIFELKGKDFLTEYYKQYRGKSESNPDGYTDEDINVYLSGKNRIEIDKEEDVLRKHLKETRASEEMKNMEVIKQREIEAFNAQEQTNQTKINDFIKTNEFTKDFFGIELSEAERTQFFKDLPGLFTRDPLTRMSKMDSLLQSESDVLKLAALVWKGENAIKSHISNVKENVKAEVESKLGVTSRIENGTVVSPKQFDPSVLLD